MAEIISLAEAVRRAGTSTDDPSAPLTIYAKRISGEWLPESPAVVLNNPEDGLHRDSRPDQGSDYEYFLELSVVTEVISGRLAQLGVREVSDDDVIRTVIYYAENDCWPEM